MMTSLGRDREETLYICLAHFPQPLPITQGEGPHGRTRFQAHATLPQSLIDSVRVREESDSDCDSDVYSDLEVEEEEKEELSQEKQVPVIEDELDDDGFEDSQEFEDGDNQNDSNWDQSSATEESESMSQSQGSTHRAYRNTHS